MRRFRKVVKSERGIYEPVLSEEDVLGQIRAYLEATGARVYRAIERIPRCYRCGLWLGSSEPGTPDLSGYIRVGGRITFPFWFEVKRPGKNKRRQAQIERIEQIKADGGCAAIVESLEEVKDAIANMQWS